MSFEMQILSNGGVEIDFGNCGCRFDAAECAELHVQLAFCLLGREFVGRTGEYPPVYVKAGDAPNSIRIATDSMAFEIPREDAEELLAKLEDRAKDGSKHKKGDANPHDDGWQVLGHVTIDSATLLLIDPMHDRTSIDDLVESDHKQIAVPGGNFSAMLIRTGMGDGRFTVEGRFADCLFGRRIAEIRMRFLDDDGTFLGWDDEQPETTDGKAAGDIRKE